MITRLLLSILPRIFVMCSLLTMQNIANAVTMDELVQKTMSYQQKFQNGDTKGAVKAVTKAYGMAKELLPPEDKSYQIIANDYAAILLSVKRYKGATTALKILLSAKEKQYGMFDKALIPVLKKLVTGTQKIAPKESQAYSIRYQKLALRHYSDQYVQQYESQVLESTQQAENLAAKLRRVTGKNYQVTDGGKWDFIYNLDSDKDFAPFIEQMELGYRSALGFLFAFNIASKPAEDKFKAVFFETRDDYKQYLHSFKSINLSESASRTTGLYIKGSIDSLFLFDRKSENKKRQKMLNHSTLQTLRHEIAHQLFFNLGLHAKGVKYPRWLTEGFAEALEFRVANKISGPQTDNINLSVIARLKKLSEKQTLTPIRRIVALTAKTENNRENGKDVYYMGSVLVRFLYQYHPEKFKKYIASFSRQNNLDGGRRIAQFYRYMGDEQVIQNQFDKYIKQLFDKVKKRE